MWKAGTRTLLTGWRNRLTRRSAIVNVDAVTPCKATACGAATCWAVSAEVTSRSRQTMIPHDLALLRPHLESVAHFVLLNTRRTLKYCSRGSPRSIGSMYDERLRGKILLSLKKKRQKGKFHCCFQLMTGGDGATPCLDVHGKGQSLN